MKKHYVIFAGCEAALGRVAPETDLLFYQGEIAAVRAGGIP